mmetsp:Transcript_91805/g.259920  ORF Transcript_91805/g.259920 Transcript_91805/m.259920 type:complete len:219 (+) Transcript_91805:222-878(+)
MDLVRQWRRLLTLHDLLQCLRHRQLLGPEVRPGSLRRDHLDDRAAEAPDVGSPAGPEVHDLRSHPVDAAVDGPQAARDGALQGLHLPASAKVRQLGVALRVNQDVRAFDVAVHDVLAVQELEALEDLPGVLAHKADAIRPEFGQHPLDRSAGHELQKDEQGRVILLVMLDAAVVPNNPRVFQPLQRVDLEQQRADLLLGRLDVEAHVERNLLDSHEPA